MCIYFNHVLSGSLTLDFSCVKFSTSVHHSRYYVNVLSKMQSNLTYNFTNLGPSTAFNDQSLALDANTKPLSSIKEDICTVMSSEHQLKRSVNYSGVLTGCALGARLRRL